MNLDSLDFLPIQKLQTLPHETTPFEHPANEDKRSFYHSIPLYNLYFLSRLFGVVIQGGM